MIFEFNNNHADFLNPFEDVAFCPNMKLQVSRFHLRDPRTCDELHVASEKQFFVQHSNSILMRVNDNFETVSFLVDDCRKESKLLLVIIVTSIVLLLLIVTLAIVACYCRRRRKLDIIMPEPRTYRQTQIVMQVETHGLIKTDF